MRRGQRSAWRYGLAGLAIITAAVAAVAVAHYWVGTGWLTYIGIRPRVFETPAATSADLAPPRDDLPGLPNFARVSPVLYRGAAATPQGYRTLKRLGVRTIVDLRELHPDRKSLRGLGLYYVHIPMNPAEIDDDEVAQFLQVVLNPRYQPVFVHCKAGADRTGVVVAIYRVVAQGWSVEQAARELDLFGFHEVFQPLLYYLKNLDSERLRHLTATVPPPDIILIP